MNEKKDIYVRWLPVILITIFVSIILVYFITKLSTYQSVYYYIFFIILTSAVSIGILFLLKKHLRPQKKRFIGIIILFIVSTSFCSYLAYSNMASTPYLFNMKESDAQNLIEKAGLTAEISYITVSDPKKTNIVLNQSFSNGILVPKGSKINITVGILESISIIEPSNGKLVGQNITINGTVKNLQNGDKVYVLVRPQPRDGDGPFEWYIQHIPVIVQADGKWKCNTFFGANGDNGREFEIVAIITNETLPSSRYGYGFELPNYTITSNSVYVTRT